MNLSLLKRRGPSLQSWRQAARFVVALGVFFAVAAKSVAQSATIPQPVTTHPRLWITPADLTRLRSWAAPSNPIYQQGLLPVLAQATVDYNTCFPNAADRGTANPTAASPYPDPGDTQGYIAITPNGGISEQDAEVFAFHSLIDPVPANRIKYAQYARNLLMVGFNEAAKGVLAEAPFRDPLFPTYNRANLAGQAWALSVDWIYNAVDANNQPILSAQDKATIRKVFLIWSDECLNAYTNGGDHPSPVGVVNDLSLLPGGGAYREAANNYYIGHGRLVMLMSLAMDPVDDPAVDSTKPVTTLGNSLRSYIANATGAWLYQEYAMFGDPATVRSDYGLSSTASVGLASGGMPPEGMLYGHSIGFMLGELLALKTSGFADPALSGPQAALANNAPVWGRFVQAFTSSLVPSSQVPTPSGSYHDPIHQILSDESYLGNVYEMASYGDILRMYITPDFVQPFALAGLLDQQNGDTSRLNAERWFVVNALQGGPSELLSRVSDPWAWGVEDSLLTFLLLDPAAAPGYAYPDPRATYPTAYYDSQQNRLVEHYPDWSATGTLFDYRCSWNSINHQQDDANQFELFRKGEWLTKGLATYDDNGVGQSTDYHNTLSLQNWCSNGTPANLQFWEAPLWPIGSQWPLGVSAGDPTVTASVSATYTYTYGDATNLYNLPSQWTPENAALDILHASRSILWLKPDHIVVYDRATSKTSGLFKRFNLDVIGTSAINGKLIATTTPGGQHLYINSLLPAGATITTGPIDPVTTVNGLSTPLLSASAGIADLEPSTARIVVEDLSHPTDVRFLHVLQAADATTAAETTTLVQSATGTPFDGAVLLDTVVLFKRDMTTPFASLSYAAPATVLNHYITGLTPGASYTINTSGNGTTNQIVVTPGGSRMADSAGVIFFNPSVAVISPSISTQPTSQTVSVGATASFTFVGAGTAPLVDQWQRLPSGGSVWTNLTEGGVYTGTTTSSLTVNSATATMNGDQFRCVVTNSASPAATTDAVTLTVNTGLLVNISTRSAVGTGNNIQIAGFVISGSQPKHVLIRASGPALNATFALSGFLSDPTLNLFQGSNLINTNTVWGSGGNFTDIKTTAARLGAFAWSDASKDSALLVNLQPGAYTAQISGQSGDSGIALVEVYDADSTSAARLINISTRALVEGGDGTQIAGFVIGGGTPKHVLIRASGPGLGTTSGLGGVLSDPVLQLYKGSNVIYANTAWGTSAQAAEIKATATRVGAFSWQDGSKDSALLVLLQPGAYTAQVSSLSGGTGIALVEVYDADSP